MPALRDIADPLRRDEALGEVRRVSGVEERVLRQVLERPARNPIPGRRAGRRRPRRSRITADAVLVVAGRAADPRHPAGDHARSRSELLRLLLLVPDQQLRVVDELGPDQLPSTVARELFRAIVLQRAPERPGRPPAVRLRRRSCSRSTTKRRRSPGRCMPSRVRTARTLDAGALDYEVARLLIELEDDQLRERSDYNEAAQGEAERAGDREAIDRLDARTTSDQRNAPVTRPAPRPDPAARQPPEVTHVR